MDSTLFILLEICCIKCRWQQSPHKQKGLRFCQQPQSMLRGTTRTFSRQENPALLMLLLSLFSRSSYSYRVQQARAIYRVERYFCEMWGINSWSVSVKVGLSHPGGEEELKHRLWGRLTESLTLKLWHCITLQLKPYQVLINCKICCFY